MKLLKKIEYNFLCSCWKTAIFEIWIWMDVLFGPLYQLWTHTHTHTHYQGYTQ
jgi:hypothetical protein